MTVEALADRQLAVSVEEGAKRLGISRTAMFGLIGSGQVRSIKVGKRRIVPVSALREFLDGQLPALDLRGKVEP
jgi:excisionase family DNA binding protein